MTGSTNPGDKTTDQIEREIARERGRIARTAEALEARMGETMSMDRTIAAVADESAAIARTVSAQIRDNPFPALLIGAGVAMLLVGGRGMARDSDDDDADDVEAAGPADRGFVAGPVGNHYDDPAGDLPPSPARCTPPARDVSGDNGASGLRDRLHDGAGRAARTAGAARRASSATQGARRRAGSLFEEHPLLVGALAFAAGAAIGGAAPNTRVENRMLGRHAESARRAGVHMAREGAATARTAAQAGAEEAAGVGREVIARGAGDRAEAAKVGKKR